LTLSTKISIQNIIYRKNKKISNFLMSFRIIKKDAMGNTTEKLNRRKNEIFFKFKGKFFS